MNCGVGLVNCFFVSSPSLPWQHGRRQQGWYIRGTLIKQFTKPTPQFILGRSTEDAIYTTYLAARVVVRIEELAGLELGGVEGTIVISIATSAAAAATGSASRPSSCPAAGRAGDSTASQFAGEFFGALRVTKRGESDRKSLTISSGKIQHDRL